MNILNQKKTSINRIIFIVACALFVLLTLLVQVALGQQPSQKTFPSAQEGARSLFLAVKQNDTPTIKAILGVEENLISLDDQDRDQRERALFVAKYQEMHRLVRESDGSMVLYLGAENWPFPVPLVSQNGAWYFDAKAGASEIVSRRIGENEEAAIEACQLLAAAEEKYKATLHNDDLQSHYAARFVSTQGKNDGLYFAADSPIPAFLANAGVSDGATQDNPPVPYEGYYFRILTQQGKDAPGGAQNYVANGQLTGGFAFVAYPAEYGTSGVMTFIVGQDKIVYERNLGPDTKNIVQAMTRFNPGRGWRRAQ